MDIENGCTLLSEHLRGRSGCHQYRIAAWIWRLTGVVAVMNEIGLYGQTVAAHLSERDLTQSAIETQRRSAAPDAETHRRLPTFDRTLAGFPRTDKDAHGMRAAAGGGRCIMFKGVAVLGLLAPLTVGNLSSPAEAAGWGEVAAPVLANLLIPRDAGWRRGGGFYRAPYYPRHYGGFYRAPYHPRYDGASYGGCSGYCGCGGYGNYGGYGGYGDDGYGW